MASPFDLTSFPGFKSFGIVSNATCDDDGAVFALQMSEKRSRGEGRMLSAESAAAKYPEESVAMQQRIINRVESDGHY